MKRQLQNLKKVVLAAALLLLISSAANAQCLTISGAGISAVNGTYTLSTSTNDYGAPFYENASGTHFIGYDGSSAWYISDYKSPWYGNDYYEGYGNSTDDPSTLTWSDNWGGATPLPSFGGCFPNDSAVLTLSLDTICFGNPVDISLVGNLSGGSNWYWYKDSVSNSPIDSGISITVTPPNANTSYYCRAENNSGSFIGDSSVITVAITSTPGKPTISGCGNNASEVTLNTDSISGALYSWGQDYTADDWSYIGDPYISNDKFPILKIDHNNTKYIAFRDKANSYKASVKKYNGTSWVNVGNAGFSPTYIYSIISLELDSAGTPYVLFRDGNYTDGLTVMKFTGTSWTTVGNRRFVTGSTTNPQLAVDNNGNCYVSYGVFSSGAVTPGLKKFNGTSWVNLTSGLPTNCSFGVELVVDNSGTPFISLDNVNTAASASHYQAMKYTGSSWSALDTTGIGSINDQGLELINSPSDTLYIMYGDFNNSSKLAVKKYNGTSWEFVGPQSISEGLGSLIDFEVSKDGKIYVSYGTTSTSNTRVKTLEDGAWVDAGLIDTFSKYWIHSLSLDTSGIPNVLLRESTQDSSVSVLEFHPGQDGKKFLAEDTSSIYHLTVTYLNGCEIKADPIKGNEIQPIAIPSIANATYQSNAIYTEGSWNHYCDCDNGLRLLSLDTTGTGAVIPADSVWVKTGTEKTKSWTTSGGLITNAKGGSAIDRKWEVSPTTQPTSDVGVRYYFSEDEYQAIKDTMANHNGGTSGYPTTISSPADLEMFKITSAGKFNDPHTTGVTGGVYANASTSSNTNWAYTAFNTNHCAEIKVSSFSGGAIGSGGGGAALGNPPPVPVELIHFTAKAADHHTANLTWATASELNNSHFEVQRSYDGASFETIDVVAGNGTINSVMEYSYSDVNIDQNENIVYYRLRQVDYDGASELTEVRKVNFRDDNILESDIVVYPNPTQDKVYISLGANPEEVVNATVIDVNGRTVANYELSQSITQIDISELESGLYFVQFSIDNKNHFVKVTKN